MTLRRSRSRPLWLAHVLAAVAVACGPGELDAPAGSFDCGNDMTISDDAVCDLEDDCGNGADELDCEGRTFVCLEGFRVPEKVVCDGRLDCPSGDDEQDCP